MSTPHKATESQWGTVRRRAEVDWNNDSTDSVLVEIADRVAALEAAATQPPAPAADHSRGAPEMVATNEELWSLYDTRRLQDRSTTAALRAVYNLGRQHSAQSRQEDLLTRPAPLSSGIEAGIDRFGEWLAREMPPGTVIGDPLNWAPRIALAVLNACQDVEPTHDLTSAAPLLWVLWHHLGASSPVGQPIRRYLGMGQHDRMTPEGIEAATRWARESMGVQDYLDSVQDYLDSIPAYSSAAPEPTPPPAPAERLLYALTSISVYGRDTLSGPENGSGSFSWYRSGIREMVQRADAAIIDFTGAANPTPPPAPTGGLVEEVARLLANRISLMLPGADCKYLARDVLVVAADWLQQRSDTIANGSQWAEMLREEADR